MGNSPITKISYEDMNNIINNTNYFIINTLPPNLQNCLIKNTINIQNEEKIINENLNNKNINIVIYGTNCCDDLLNKKCNQLITLGFKNIYVYFGGMFEWLLMQDIYGSDMFETTNTELDILKYKPKNKII